MVESVRVTVRYFAAARAAAGTDHELLTVDEPATVGSVLSRAAEHHGPELALVLRRCSFLLGEIAVNGTETPVADGDCLDVLPPFAGG